MMDIPDIVDILVIGGGPAGLSAAYSAAEKGAKVLLVEKKREIGVPIQCGEFMPSPSEIPDILPDAVHIRLLEGYPDDVVLNRTRSIAIYSASGKPYIIPFEGYVIDRERFDKWIARLATKAGAKILLSTTAIGIDDSTVKLYIEGEKRSITYKVAIIASGAGTQLLDAMPIKPKLTEYDYSPVHQWVMSGIDVDPGVVEMYSGTRYAPGTYAWIIPRSSDLANVGLGVREPFNRDKVSIKEYLRRFIYEHPIASGKLKEGSPLSSVGGIVPAGPPLKTAVWKRVIVIGDAANMTIASIGAGVPTGVISGEIAGIIASEYIDKGSSLGRFDELWKKEIGGPLNNGYKIRLMMDPVLKRDDLMDIALEMMGERLLSEIIRCRIPKLLNALYPILAGLMRMR